MLYKMTGSLPSQKQALWILSVVLITAAGGEKLHFVPNKNMMVCFG